MQDLLSTLSMPLAYLWLSVHKMDKNHISFEKHVPLVVPQARGDLQER